MWDMIYIKNSLRRDGSHRRDLHGRDGHNADLENVRAKEKLWSVGRGWMGKWENALNGDQFKAPLHSAHGITTTTTVIGGALQVRFIPQDICRLFGGA